MYNHIRPLILVLLLTSCAQLEQIPDGTNTTAGLFKNQKDAEAAVNGMYSALQSQNLYNQFNETIQSQGTDDAEWGFGRNTNNTDKLALDKFTYTASTNLAYAYWRTLYQNINRANLVLKYVAPMSIPEAKKQQYLGEAHFIRGLMYFTLSRLYGSVPIVTEATEDLDDLEVARSPLEAVNQLIAEDFLYAKANLPLTYQTIDRGRATKGAAMALLAKVYLTGKQYQKTVDECKEITALGIYELWPTYEEVFRITNKNQKESIFEIQFRSLGSIGNNNGSTYNGFFKPPATVVPVPAGKFAGYGDNPVTENHYKAYPAGDLRREVNVKYYPNAPKSILYPYYVNKYVDPAAFNVNDGGNNYFIARYADILLMQAEALHEITVGSKEAYELFNKVRRRAYSLPVSVVSIHDLKEGLTVEQFRDTILLERRLEFAFEGHRRFDLLRMGKLKQAMAVQDPSIVVADRHLLLPIPQDELIVNPLLDQNLGY
ncbi:RagB/SusD family nutrient uptake outer membrane protein [Dyadobacter psychrotolerans]|uniref:RagB/SusD family nutrient uptake outer membrane protein n=1 Tax=Dyadobacter psychrotolerans TaxID=2541721 RepID=A0A4R5DC41_9BACT|nr:RagB/SusD family nutrient uptake outer membrane protein [Dyadobacter psychrotolerans]TDE10507.1 RagB/SusD family nutrient uptake outer membrane protein [Dyadobacter psychrotolerans]